MFSHFSGLATCMRLTSHFSSLATCMRLASQLALLSPDSFSLLSTLEARDTCIRCV
jgi:hypothetical protein